MFLEIERLKKGKGKSVKRFDVYVYVNVNPAANYRA